VEVAGLTLWKFIERIDMETSIHANHVLDVKYHKWAVISMIIVTVTLVACLTVDFAQSYPELAQNNSYFYPVCICWTIMFIVAAMHFTNLGSPHHSLKKMHPVINVVSSISTIYCLLACLFAICAPDLIFGIINPKSMGQVNGISPFFWISVTGMSILHLLLWTYDLEFTVTASSKHTALVNGIPIPPKQKVRLSSWKEFEITEQPTENIEQFMVVDGISMLPHGRSAFCTVK